MLTTLPNMILASLPADKHAMAIRHTATVLCEQLIRSDEQRFTLVNIFRNIHVKKFPAVKDPMGIYVEFSGEEGDPFQILLKGPKRYLLTLQEDTIGVKPPSKPHQQASTISAIIASPAVFPHPGVYSVVLKSKDKTIHSHTFGIFLRETMTS